MAAPLGGGTQDRVPAGAEHGPLSESRSPAVGAVCYGVPFRLEGASADLLREIAARLPPLVFMPASVAGARRYRIERVQPGDAFRLRRGGGRPVPAGSASEAADLVVADLQRTVALQAEDLLLVHAGAVALRGRALLLPGSSGSGKSRLVEALLRQGADYLSDELAVLDRQGRVHPWARLLARRTNDGGGVRRLDPVHLGARPRRRPVPVTAIACLRYRPGALWRPRPISAGEGFLKLLRQSLAARRRLDLARAVLLPLAATARLIAGDRAEAEEAAALLRAEGW